MTPPNIKRKSSRESSFRHGRKEYLESLKKSAGLVPKLPDRFVEKFLENKEAVEKSCNTLKAMEFGDPEKK